MERCTTFIGNTSYLCWSAMLKQDVYQQKFINCLVIRIACVRRFFNTTSSFLIPSTYKLVVEVCCRGGRLCGTWALRASKYDTLLQWFIFIFRIGSVIVDKFPKMLRRLNFSLKHDLQIDSFRKVTIRLLCTYLQQTCFSTSKYLCETFENLHR